MTKESTEREEMDRRMKLDLYMLCHPAALPGIINMLWCNKKRCAAIKLMQKIGNSLEYTMLRSSKDTVILYSSHFLKWLCYELRKDNKHLCADHLL